MGILEPMKPGDSVLVQDPKTSRWSIEANVVSRGNKRSYIIEIDGCHHIRNQRFLKLVNAPKETNTKETYPKEMDSKETDPKETAPKETRSNKKKNKLHVTVVPTPVATRPNLCSKLTLLKLSLQLLKVLLCCFLSKVQIDMTWGFQMSYFLSS